MQPRTLKRSHAQWCVKHHWEEGNTGLWNPIRLGRGNSLNIHHRIQSDLRATQQDPAQKSRIRRSWQGCQSIVTTALEEKSHTIPLNLEMAHAGKPGGRADEQTFTQDLHHWVLVSNPLLLFFYQWLPHREHEIFLHVGQGCVYQLVENYMVNTDPPG